MRVLVLNDVKGETLEKWYKTSLEEFCRTLQKLSESCFIGSQFWKIYWEKFQVKVSII